MKNSVRSVLLAGVMFLLSWPAWSHVVVKPSQAGVASFVTFNVSVPNEKDVANTQLKLMLPPGLGSVSPTVKPGWKITVEKDAKGNPTAILWTGGSLPPEFRDDFSFSAQMPDKPADLPWKAYQTYKDGEVVGWDVDPADPSAKDSEALEKTGKGPYSVTKVIDDLTPSASALPIAAPAADSTGIAALVIAIAALVIALGGLFFRHRKK
jgi:uncharacterized protein YcnI